MSGPMLDDVRVSMQKFGWPDYSVFIVMLVICALIGVYFGFIEKKPAKKCDEESDYLVGGRQMKVVPIVMSLIARYVCESWKNVSEIVSKIVYWICSVKNR